MFKCGTGDAYYKAYCGFEESDAMYDVRLADALARKWSYDGIATLCICFPYQYFMGDENGKLVPVGEELEYVNWLKTYAYGEEVPFQHNATLQGILEGLEAISRKVNTMKLNSLYVARKESLLRECSSQAEFYNWGCGQFSFMAESGCCVIEISGRGYGLRDIAVSIYRDDGVCIATHYAHMNSGSYCEDILKAVYRALKDAAFSVDFGFERIARDALLLADGVCKTRDHDFVEYQPLDCEQ